MPADTAGMSEWVQQTVEHTWAPKGSRLGADWEAKRGDGWGAAHVAPESARFNSGSAPTHTNAVAVQVSQLCCVRMPRLRL